jgi:hypothetical protein
MANTTIQLLKLTVYITATSLIAASAVAAAKEKQKGLVRVSAAVLPN